MPGSVKVIFHVSESSEARQLGELLGGPGRHVLRTDTPEESVAAARDASCGLVILAEATDMATVEALRALPHNPRLMVLAAGDVDAAALRAAGVQVVMPWASGVAPAAAAAAEALIQSWRLRSQLDQSELQYTELLENTRDAIYILGPARFTFVNRAFEELIGYVAEEICSDGFDPMRLIAPESRPMIEERSRLAAAGEQLPPRYEFMALTRAGHRIDLAVSVSYIVYAGEPSTLGVVQDITARKQYEKALLRRNRELAVLNDLAATVSRASDLNTVLETAVERLIAVMGFNAAGISLLDGRRNVVRARLYRGVSSEQMDRIKELPITEGIIGQAIRTGDVQVVHDTLKDNRVDRSAVYTLGFRSAVCVPIQAKDRVLGSAVGLCSDAREFAPEELSLLLSIGHQLGTAVERATLHDHREAAMQRLLALEEMARALSSTLDLQEVFRVAATQLQRVMRADGVELCLLREAAGQRQLEVVMRRTGIRWEAGGRLWSPNADAAWTGLRANSPTTVLVTQETHGPWAREGIRAAAVAPLVLDGKPVGVVLAGFADPQRVEEASEFLGSVGAHLALALRNARMFSDLEAAYGQLKDAKDRLVMQEKLSALGEMSAGVAHDFNNVLGAILGRTQLLKTFVTDSAVHKSLGIIERAALDGAATVRRIQEFSRMGGEEDFSPVDLDEVAAQAVEMTQARWSDRAVAEGITLEVGTDLHGPPRVLGNAQQLREVLTNLIHNACDAMPRGGAITVHTGNANGRCFISVEDTGTGIPPEVRSRVFDPFFTTKGVRGTGLGLSVSYGIVQRHHGEFVLDTEVGRGTTFTIWLSPAEAELQQERPARTLSVVPGLQEVASPPARKGARVLIVDDEENIRDVLGDMLAAADHHVDVAVDGESALQRLPQLMEQGLDVMFTDLGMPGMSGWELAAAVKTRWPELPVGLITGWGATLDMDKMRQHGVDLVVPKPFKFDQVTSVVAEALLLQQARGSRRA